MHGIKLVQEPQELKADVPASDMQRLCTDLLDIYLERNGIFRLRLRLRLQVTAHDNETQAELGVAFGRVLCVCDPEPFVEFLVNSMEYEAEFIFTGRALLELAKKRWSLHKHANAIAVRSNIYLQQIIYQQRHPGGAAFLPALGEYYECLQELQRTAIALRGQKRRKSISALCGATVVLRNLKN